MPDDLFLAMWIRSFIRGTPTVVKVLCGDHVAVHYSRYPAASGWRSADLISDYLEDRRAR